MALFTLQNCKNDIDINDEWKETMVVYGMLNPADTVQFIRVSKAFLDETRSALLVAGITDSIYYDSLEVWLKRPDTTWAVKLEKINYIQKDSGLFGNDKNPLYKTNAYIRPNREYELEVINPKTGKRVWARTKSVAPANIVAPFRNPGSNFSIMPEYFTIEFTPQANSYAYDVKLEVVYQEFSLKDTSAKTTKTAVWNAMTNFRVSPSVSAINKIPRLAVLQFLGNTIKSDSLLGHRILYANLVLYGGNQTLVDFISVNEPSIGIVQKTSEFSNIHGGYGIFASRCVQRVERAKLDPGSINFLRTHPETRKLNLFP